MEQRLKIIPRKIKKAAASSITGTLVRFGFVVRGVLYIIFGLYGLAAAIGLQGNINSTAQIVKILGSLPLGKVVLTFVFIGLVGYGSWGLIRATLDPLKKGSGAKGLIIRIGYLTSGLSYLALSILPIHLLLNTVSASPSNSKSSALLLFQIPGGFFAVTVVGLVIMAGGISQMVYGFKESFDKSLQTAELGKKKRTVFLTGKYGYVARGVVFILIGFFFLKAGITIDAVQAKDPGEILFWAWQQSGGPVLLGIISAGLIALGVYSVAVSRAVKLTGHDKT